MNNMLKKTIKYLAVAAAFILLINITSKIFFSAENEKENNTIRAVESGSLEDEIPTIAKSIEEKLEFSRGSEMLEHYEVRGEGKNDNIYGYVQIWKTDETLEHYIDLCKEYMSRNVYGFTENNIKIGDVSWRKWEYIVNGISVSQAFCKMNDKIYLCSLFVPYQERTYGFDQVLVELLQKLQRPFKPTGHT